MIKLIAVVVIVFIVAIIVLSTMEEKEENDTDMEPCVIYSKCMCDGKTECRGNPMGCKSAHWISAD